MIRFFLLLCCIMFGYFLRRLYDSLNRKPTIGALKNYHDDDNGSPYIFLESYIDIEKLNGLESVCLDVKDISRN